MSLDRLHAHFTIVGPDGTDGDVVARDVLRRMSEAQNPTQHELLLVRSYLSGRPVIAVGTTPSSEGGWDAELLDLYGRRIDSIAQLARSVGVIETIIDSSPAGAATGFLVDDKMLVTNAHVVRELAAGTDDSAPVVRFPSRGSEPAVQATFDRVRLINGRADIAFVSLAQWTGRQPAALKFARGPVDDRTQIAVVGYPQIDGDLPPLLTKNLFGPQVGKESVSPGRVLRRYATSSFEHDCTTAGGNSGSPVVRLFDGAVLGVHRGGALYESNLATASEKAATLHDTVPDAGRSFTWAGLRVRGRRLL